METNLRAVTIYLILYAALGLMLVQYYEDMSRLETRA